MKRPFWFKSLSLFLAFSMVHLNLAWAGVDLRQIIIDAKKAFELFDEGRRTGITIMQLSNNAAQQTSEVNQQETL